MTSTGSHVELKTTAHKMASALDLFRDIDSGMTVGEIAAFLLIAQGETKDGGGLTVEELMKAGEFALSSASRYSNGLADKNRKGEPGRQLVTNFRDPADDRRKVLRLTPKGARLIQQIGRAIA